MYTVQKQNKKKYKKVQQQNTERGQKLAKYKNTNKMQIYDLLICKIVFIGFIKAFVWHKKNVK